MNLWSAKTVLEKSGCFNPDMKPVWVWTVIVLNAWGSCRDELLFKLSRHRAPAIWLLAVGPSAFTICWLETHTRTHAAVTVLSSIEMWQIILKKSCDLTDWVMDVLASKMVSCLSAEVKHDMNHQRGEDSFTFGWSQTGDTVKKKKMFHISGVCLLFLTFAFSLASLTDQNCRIFWFDTLSACARVWWVYAIDYKNGLQSQLTKSRCFLCFSFNISIKRYKRKLK